MRRNKIIIICVAIVLLVVGCASLQKSVTQEQKARTAKRLDDTAEGLKDVSGIATALGVIWPAAIPIGTLLLGAAGVAKKLKPELEAAETKADVYINTATGLVKAIEEYKVAHPEGWESLKIFLQKKVGIKAEETIRKIRQPSV